MGGWIDKVVRLAWLTSLLLASFSSLAATHTPFTAHYEVYFKEWHLGQGTYSLSHQGGDLYRFSFSGAIQFLIFTDAREVSSEFVDRNNRAIPLRYQHNRTGTGSDYADSILFDPATKKITSTVRKKVESIPYDAELLDGLVVQFQLMLDLKNGVAPLRYRVLEDLAVEEILFEEKPAETLTISGKQYNCRVVEGSRLNGSRVTRIWFAKNLDFMPVQMAYYVNGAKRFSAEMASFSRKEG